MDIPSKTEFYKHMEIRHKKDFKGRALRNKLYLKLLDTIDDASKSDKALTALANMTLMSKTDRLIYRNDMAERGIELTPIQVDLQITTIEYALEYVH